MVRIAQIWKLQGPRALVGVEYEIFDFVGRAGADSVNNTSCEAEARKERAR